MVRRQTHISLNVFLNGRLVGFLRRMSTGAIDFQYDASWLDWESALPISLSLPLRESRYVGAPVAAVLDNLLPDNEDIRRRLAARVKVEGHDPYSLLSVIGRDCAGALQFLPDGEEPGPVGQISGRPISDDDVARILEDLGRTPLGLTEEGEFRMSIAGAQEKTALLFWNGQWIIPHGSTATTHILKPQIGRRGILDFSMSVENEYLCMQFTAALGLPTARTSMMELGGKRVLMVERFDRLWTEDGRLLRLPQEDCCQALSVPPNLKYEADGGPGIGDILTLLKGSDDPEYDQKMFMKAMIVFWLMGATDSHAKNFSVFLGPGGRFHMTPLYDVMSAQPYFDTGQITRNKVKLALSVGKRGHYTVNTIVPRHFIETAEESGMPARTVQALLEELLVQTPDAIDIVLKNLPPNFPEEIASSISEGMKHRLGQIRHSV